MTTAKSRSDNTAETNLRELCKEYLDLGMMNYPPDNDGDLKHYIFEAAMEFVYGKDVWVKLRTGQIRAEIERKKEEIEKLLKEIEE